jgi:uncharacterized protein YndB with AHSA1/START domain
MKILLRVVIALLLLGGGVYLYALSIPADQTITRTMTLKQTPETIFELLDDVENMPKWNRSLERVEVLPPIDGKAATRQTFNGKMQMTIVTSESAPPHRLVRSMGDTGGPFVGSWTYDIKPTEGGSEVALTENSQMKNPFFRLVVKLFGPTRYMDEHLEDIAKNFGETAVIR